MNKDNILNDVMPRLISAEPGDSLLGMEILRGPYKGSRLRSRSLRS